MAGSTTKPDGDISHQSAIPVAPSINQYRSCVRVRVCSLLINRSPIKIACSFVARQARTMMTMRRRSFRLLVIVALLAATSLFVDAAAAAATKRSSANNKKATTTTSGGGEGPFRSFVRSVRDSRRHLVAAAAARTASIFAMFPVDTIKVRACTGAWIRGKERRPPPFLSFLRHKSKFAPFA